MARKRFSPEQIIMMLRKAEVLINQSIPIAKVYRKLEISEQTYYRSPGIPTLLAAHRLLRPQPGPGHDQAGS
jgi:hypothetical protein